MSSPQSIPPSEFETLSMEEQIEYVETHLDDIVSSIRKAAIPEWHKEFLIEAMGRYRSSYEQAITWEEFEEELEKELIKD
jgi:hypothetical protein